MVDGHGCFLKKNETKAKTTTKEEDDHDVEF
jgi:hypothetical protein